MSVDETLMCSFNILKPADKKTNAQRPKTPKVWFGVDLFFDFLPLFVFLNN